MQQGAIEKIHICLNELQMMRQLIDSKVADDFCSRLLGIYVMIRVDDITKIWCHNVPQDVMERQLVDGVKRQYNDGLRILRDKLGAHCQNVTDDDLFGNVKLFKSIDYAKTDCIIDAVIEVESKLEGRSVIAPGFRDPSDLTKAKEILRKLNSDDQACITCGSLDIFGINKGGLVSTTKEQAKGQLLRSIELMVAISYELMSGRYSAIEVERMFKRLYICMVYNYHDNLITRKDINDKTVQYEEGFDILFKKLITIYDNREMLENAFSKFEKLYQVEPIIKKYRDIRNTACAHFSEKATISDIDNGLDSVDIGELDKAYQNMLMMFNFLCKSVFCLQMLNLPARSPLFDAQLVGAEDNVNYYGESLETELPKEMSCTEILRSIRRHDNKYEEACAALNRKLMSQNDGIYAEMANALKERLREPSISGEELSVVIQSLSNARRGFPDRLQGTVFEMLADDSIFKNCYLHLLWVLSSICREDDNVDIRKALDSIISQQKIIPTALSILALLHLAVENGRTIGAIRGSAHDVDSDIIRYCSSITQPTEKLLVMIVLGQHWFWDIEYVHYRSYETKYTEYIVSEVKKALDHYLRYIKLQDASQADYLKNCLDNNFYLLALYRLAYYEKARNQNPNLFLTAWSYNCFIWTRENMYEGFGVGLICELEGNKELARDIFKSLHTDNPLSEDAINTLKDFYQRNPEMKS